MSASSQWKQDMLRDDDDDDDGTARRQLERLASVVDLTKQSQQQQSWGIRVVLQ